VDSDASTVTDVDADSFQSRSALPDPLPNETKNPPVKLVPPTAPRKSLSPIHIARSPARIDLAGGWSDTPPICYHVGGAVMNIAIRINNMYPIRCAARFLLDQPTVRLISVTQPKDEKASEGLPPYRSKRYSTVTVEYSRDDVVQMPLNPSADCALLVACMLRVGWLKGSHVRYRNITSRSVEPAGVAGAGADIIPDNYDMSAIGLEVITCSALPAGSGMGGSSIIAAAVLAAVFSCCTGSLPSQERIIELVSVANSP